MDFEKMTAEEIEAYRGSLQEDIERLRAELVRAGKVLERKRLAEPLEKKKAEIERALEALAPPAQMVMLQPLSLSAKIKKWLSGSAGQDGG
jgi:hypothetical protein